MRDTDCVQKAIDYIEDGLHEDLELTEIANAAHMSVAQLYRMFYAMTGHPVKEYIRKRRVSVAANHLRHSSRSVEGIALDCGFESYHAFAKVFKKIAGLTPSAYRTAGVYFSFEPIRLNEKVQYVEDREVSELFPDVKVIRLWPAKVYTHLHVTSEETGMENDAYRTVYEQISRSPKLGNTDSKIRFFGHNVSLPLSREKPRYGYRIFVLADDERLEGSGLREDVFPGGLYAVRKTIATSPRVIQEAWDRLLSEWLPKSTFELGKHQYMEEFIAYNGSVKRMNLYLPVERKLRPDSIEVVELKEMRALYCRGTGREAQADAECGLIAWYERLPADRRERIGCYYMSFQYGARSMEEDYWWENGVICRETASDIHDGLSAKTFKSGFYACCLTKPYGLLTGVLDKMHRWIAASGSYRLDADRQWYAEYEAFDGTDPETGSIVKIYVPIK